VNGQAGKPADADNERPIVANRQPPVGRYQMMVKRRALTRPIQLGQIGHIISVIGPRRLRCSAVMDHVAEWMRR
jgi:hypothetical protein